MRGYLQPKLTTAGLNLILSARASRQPVATNTSLTGRAANRRVDVAIRRKWQSRNIASLPGYGGSRAAAREWFVAVKVNPTERPSRGRTQPTNETTDRGTARRSFSPPATATRYVRRPEHRDDPCDKQRNAPSRLGFDHPSPADPPTPAPDHGSLRSPKILPDSSPKARW